MSLVLASVEWETRTFRSVKVAPRVPSRPRADELPICGQCPRCHPGRSFGGDEMCRGGRCACHHYRRPA